MPAHVRWKSANAAAWRRYDDNERRGGLVAKRQFKKRHGYDLDLENPQTHNERVYLRKLKDHDPRFARLTDKAKARKAIDECLGEGSADQLCVPILAHVTAFDDLSDAIWSRDIVLKCTHGSAMNCTVRAGDLAARRRARKKITKLLGQVHGRRRFEWCYFDLSPSVIVEPLLGAISDLKLYFYDGVLRLIMPEDNSERVPAITIFTPDWVALPMRLRGFRQGPIARPAMLDEIIAIATPLAQGFDMIRVDFMLSNDRFYLGELTLYDGSGLDAFDSYDNDRLFAAHWRQPHLEASVG